MIKGIIKFIRFGEEYCVVNKVMYFLLDCFLICIIYLLLFFGGFVKKREIYVVLIIGGLIIVSIC